MNKIMKNKLKKLKVITKVLFGRTAIVILALVAQMIFFLASVQWLSEYSTVIYGGFILLAAVTLIHILNEESNASFKMAWMIPILLVPVFGTVVYLYVNMQLGTKMMNRRLTDIDSQYMPLLQQNVETFEKLSHESAGEKGLAQYLYHAGNLAVYEENSIEFFPLGEDKFAEMIKQIKAAREFIFMEYFIVSEGYMLDTIIELLRKKAAEGVEVRFMYDGMCSLAMLPYGYYKTLNQMGIKSRPFSQIRPVLSTVQNNRDHRKILIIDGKTVFTGGINLADEYINKIVRFGHWKDTAIMIQGEAVKSFTYMFLKMWNVADYKNHVSEEDIKKYIHDIVYKKDSDCAEKENDNLHKGGYVIPYCDGPFEKERIGKQVYIDILNRARHYVHIMTPYLILDDEMLSALCYCAKRGVETVIIMPHVPDKLYAYLLSRTYYRELLEHGVKIYEYIPGFVHAKLFVSDGIRASVGSINLDFRSMYLHFECAAYMYENCVAQDIEQDFQYTLSKCEQITLESCDRYPKVKTLVGKVLRLFAPLM